jgi:hypothetical protein
MQMKCQQVMLGLQPSFSWNSELCKSSEKGVEEGEGRRTSQQATSIKEDVEVHSRDRIAALQGSRTDMRMWNNGTTMMA